MVFEANRVDEEVAGGFQRCERPSFVNAGLGGRVSSQKVLDHPILSHIGDQVFGFWCGEFPGSFELRYLVL